ncbi:protein kinase [Nannocystis sp.]|uniref:bifunctional serine/threonine-protein kinase/ABC transporter substrate-binding protein n=1 Tax=Nannocystis sp. TaxID=1962667 RepID=UPI0025DF26E3|nr:protein kinase [Nannocystis sp.]MBK7827396.1 protein kinase [Nannocystis sp.]
MVDTGAMGQDPDERRIGSVLRERYRITGVIGAGGMATVYLAVHRNGNRVALKMLHPELSRQAAHRERFVREGYVANKVEHPGAVRVLDDDVADDGCPFLVMELLIGESLAAHLRRRGRLAPREVLAIGHALCDVLARAHACGVVHRDIKPDNLFLTTSGELKVLDFGIARVVQEGRESATRTGHMLGTPAFMPPEQALGRRHAIDGRSDLWAVGATMFTAIAGRPVHQGDAPEEVMVRSATEPAPGLASVAPEVPAAIAAVVDRALAFAPDQRFADAAAMQAAIAAAHLAVFGAGIEATPRPRGEPTTVTEPIATTDTLPSDPGHARTLAGTRPPSSQTGVDALGATRVAVRPSTVSGADRELSPPPPPRRSRARVLAAAAVILAVSAMGFAAWRASAGCTTNADCAGGEGPAICRADQGRCVPLTTGLCRVLADDDAVTRDDTLWIGAMYPEHDQSSDYGREAGRLLELAQRDFQGLTGGLPPSRPGGLPRPIGVIVCDDTDEYEASAAHLVDEVGVPAILGFGRSKEVLDLANRHFVPKGVLALASNTAAMLSSIPHPQGEVRLVYRVTTSTALRAPPSVALVRQAIEPGLRDPGGALGPDGTLRVAILQSSEAAGTSYSDALLTEMRATRPGGREDVRPFVIADDSAVDPAPLERVAAEVAAFAPHVVFDGGAPSQLLAHIEAAWPGEPRPQYVYGARDFSTVLELARAHPDFSGRFHMISNRDNPTHAKVRAHYMAMFGDGGAEFSPTPYDAFYVLAYAAVAVGDGPLTGRSLARAMPRLGPPGVAIGVGPADIYPALKALGRGDNIDLQGTRTSLDFDPETGDATADFALFCIDAAAGRMRETNAHYDAASRRYTAPARCP